MKNKRLFLLDIDGTIAFDSTLIDGTLDFMNWVRAIKGKYIFITNNSTKSIKDYVDKFNNLGIPVDNTNFLTSSYATALYLKEHYDNQKLFVLGTESFQHELKEFGLDVTDNLDQIDEITCAVVGFDNELNFKKVETICNLLLCKSVDYIATNPDYACPTSFGFVPDCGAICEFIGHAVKRLPLYIGKPNKSIVELALQQNDLTKEETLVIGDRFYTDIACGINGGVDTAVVYTGEAKEEDLKHTEFVPTFAFENIRTLYEVISRDF